MSLVNWFCDSKRRPASRRPGAARFRPRLESLERRDLPSGPPETMSLSNPPSQAQITALLTDGSKIGVDLVGIAKDMAILFYEAEYPQAATGFNVLRDFLRGDTTQGALDLASYLSNPLRTYVAPIQNLVNDFNTLFQDIGKTHNDLLGVYFPQAAPQPTPQPSPPGGQTGGGDFVDSDNDGDPSVSEDADGDAM